MTIRLCTVLFVSLLPALAPSFAQEYRGTLLGRVTDHTGAAVPEAAVAATNKETGVALKSVTNAEGLYQIPFVIPGEYSLAVTKSGFKKAEAAGVRVSVNASVTVDIALEVGQVNDSITVRAEAPLLNVTNADLGQVIDSSFINVVNVSLSRNIVNLAQLAPGVTGSTGSYTSAAQNNFSITGGGSTQGRNEYLVDGLPSSVPDGITFVPSLDSVAEVKIQTTLFDAQFGRSNGGAVNITTKGGTNDLHGVGYWFKRWTALNANSWNNNRLGLERPPVKYDQYGFLVSGPVLVPKVFDGRNRTFFSVSFEKDNDSRELTRQARVPTDLERRGDFSQTLNLQGRPLTIYDPATTVVAGTAARRDPFANGRIPESRLNATGRAAVNALPAPTASSVLQLGAFNWAGTGIYAVRQRNFNTRVDHNLGSKHRLFGRLGVLRREQDPDELIANMFEFPGQGGTDLDLLIRNFYSLSVDDTITFSPSFIASVRYGGIRRKASSERGRPDFDVSAFNLAPALAQNRALPRLPVFRFGENTPAVGSSLSSDTDNQHALLATFSKLTGSHTFKFGADYRNIRLHNFSPGANAPGQFTFGTVFTRQDPFNPRSADTTGSGLASALLGIPESGGLGFNSANSLQSHYTAVFFQDDWKVSRKLTLNFGVRWEWETPFTERYNRAAYGYDGNAAFPLAVPGLNLQGGLLFAGVDSNPRRMGKLDGNNLGPRFGFAWNVMPKTVVRGGYGVFFSSLINNDQFSGAVATFNANTTYVGTVDNATPFTTLANPFPNGLRQPLGTSQGLAAQAGDALSVYNSNRAAPYNQQWQFGVSRELPWNGVVDIAYVGSHALKQLESFNLNETPDSFLALGNAANDRVNNPFRGIFPVDSTLGTGTTITRNRFWPRFPQYTTLTLVGNNTGRGLYHSLQISYNKRMSNGLSVIWNYTFARLMDNNTTSIVNERRYRSVSPLDQKHVMRMAVSYQIPGRFANRPLQYVLGGWSISSVLQAATGTPLSVTHPNGRPIRLRDPRREGAVSGRLGDRRNPDGTIANPYFDTGAFLAFASPFVVTPEPPVLDELRAPGTLSLNAFLFKQVPVFERLKLEIRMESTGLTNTPNFNAPGTALNNTATFGVINGAGGSRQMQGALRLIF